jgi:1,4-alpha-glucan branching enzyme
MGRFIDLRIALWLTFAALVASCGGKSPGAGADSAAGPQPVAGGVLFVCPASGAQRVVIVGDFNNWSTNSDPMYDREEKGWWSITLPLKPGRYEYKYLIDGKKWMPDPENPKKIEDGFGGYNSVVEVD